MNLSEIKSALLSICENGFQNTNEQCEALQTIIYAIDEGRLSIGKCSGLVRKIDDLGRIYIPKNIREEAGVRTNPHDGVEPVSFEISCCEDSESIVLRRAKNADTHC